MEGKQFNVDLEQKIIEEINRDELGEKIFLGNNAVQATLYANELAEELKKIDNQESENVMQHLLGLLKEFDK